MTQEKLEQEVRQLPLTERLSLASDMIAQMCKEGRPPKMTIPVRWDNEDFFIGVTLMDAIGQFNAAESLFSAVMKEIHDEAEGALGYEQACSAPQAVRRLAQKYKEAIAANRWSLFIAEQKEEMRLGFYQVRVEDNDPDSAKGYNEMMLFGHIEGDFVVDFPSRSLKFPVGDVSHFCFIPLPAIN